MAVNNQFGLLSHDLPIWGWHVKFEHIIYKSQSYSMCHTSRTIIFNLVHNKNGIKYVMNISECLYELDMTYDKHKHCPSEHVRDTNLEQRERNNGRWKI